jgi:hypothetical protein
VKEQKQALKLLQQRQMRVECIQDAAGQPPWLTRLFARVQDEDVQQLLLEHKDKLQEHGLTLAAGLQGTSQERLEALGFKPGHAAAIKLAFADIAVLAAPPRHQDADCDNSRVTVLQGR